MVLCIDCENLFIRKDETTTYFCLTQREYIDEVDIDIDCPDYQPAERPNS
ncbi:MAG: hypothetical protein NWE89_09535 [Candidatus Bathyarchaeota archaeon]|nr:hypothetical protein [Candidatus Bathyarchaeota archaeon]